MRIFLSSRYSRKEELKGYRERLQQLGHEVVARWLDTEWTETERESQVYSSAAPPEYRTEYAVKDMQDVEHCDVFLAFTEDPRSNTRGGRHVEMGAALLSNKIIFVIGPRENLFYYHPRILAQNDTFDAFMRHFRYCPLDVRGVMSRTDVNKEANV